MLGQLGVGARIETIAGGKCFVHEERPAEFVAHAAPFLAHALSAAAPADVQATQSAHR
jgi:hypothetical protein